MTPFRKSSTAITTPEHVSNLDEELVLVTSILFISGKLSYVLESTLPDRFQNCSLDAIGKALLALEVCNPLKENVA